MGRSHITESTRGESKSSLSNLSIVQGSGIGPTLYVILKSDLKPLSNQNIMFKLANDTNLLVPKRTHFQHKAEFDAIQSWAAKHKMMHFL
jgi:hypothetical protein